MIAQAIHVIELRDEQGVFCNVWQGGPNDTAPVGDLKATYSNLEAAAWAIAGHEAKQGQEWPIVIHTDEGDEGDHEHWRFNQVMVIARRYYNNMRTLAAAPRDKLTGRPLFVSL